MSKLFNHLPKWGRLCLKVFAAVILGGMVLLVLLVIFAALANAKEGVSDGEVQIPAVNEHSISKEAAVSANVSLTCDNGLECAWVELPSGGWVYIPLF